MRICYLTHSLLSCWNHGNAHFQRGLLRDLVRLGHEAIALEPATSWSRDQLVAAEGEAPLARVRARFPEVPVHMYAGPQDLARHVEGADAVIVHEWTAPEIIRALADLRRSTPFLLLFHDTHHRAVTAPERLLPHIEGFDAILAFGASLAKVYARHGWRRRVFVFHEAADAELFAPPAHQCATRDGILWIGNFGDGERTRELETFLLRPARAAGLPLDIYGVRFPASVRARLPGFGARYNGWIANLDVPACMADYLCTIHVPRRTYVDALPGIPTIRVFEALAAGLPLLSAPWNDCEGLFNAGQDYLTAKDEGEMCSHLRALVHDCARAAALAAHGRATIEARHTTRHRAYELCAIIAGLRGAKPSSLVEAAQ